MDLTEYLVEQVFQTPSHRFAALRDFYPTMKEADWQLDVAGQRVQIIKKDQKHTGVLEFGTEIVAAADHSLVALLGASPALHDGRLDHDQGPGDLLPAGNQERRLGCQAEADDPVLR